MRREAPAVRTGNGAAGDRALLGRLGLRVRVVRTRRQMSQDDLAQLAGLDRTYVSRVERGAHNVTVLTLIRVAEALDVVPGELLDSAVADDEHFMGLPRRRIMATNPPAVTQAKLPVHGSTLDGFRSPGGNAGSQDYSQG
jgi:transcriptional regulator with XRE-family HTH domain